MIYSEDELKRWWDGLSKQEQAEILGTMIEKMNQTDFAVSLSKQYSMGKSFSPKQLAAIRKWSN